MNLNQTPYQTPSPWEYQSREQFRSLLEKQADLIRAQQAQIAQQAQLECKCHVIDTNKTAILM
jgi:hypothetical protein